jgi:hypothetical protein
MFWFLKIKLLDYAFCHQQSEDFLSRNAPARRLSWGSTDIRSIFQNENCGINCVRGSIVSNNRLKCLG